MINYIITRFSVLDYNTNAFKLTKNNRDKGEQHYKDSLFNTERLDHKFNVFENVTYKSIIEQTSQNYVWLIYSSVFLPDNYKKKLEKIVEKNDKVKIFYIKNFKEFIGDIEKHIDKNIDYSTIRLDDDDWLNKNFLFDINTYKNEKDKIISFPIGNRFKLDKNNKILIGHKIDLKNNAQGLTAIGMNIYKCGNHINVHLRYDVIYNYKPKAFLLCCSEHTDTRRKFV